MMKRLSFVGIYLGAVVWCGAATRDVEIINFAFSPSTVQVNVADSVRWIERDAPPTFHTSTSGQSPNPNGLWNSGALEEKIIAIKIVERIGKNDPSQVLS